MRNTVSIQLVNGNHSRVAKQRKLITSIILWTVQGIFALMFLLVGGMKLILPIQMLLAQMPMPLPGLFVRFIGLAEVAGGLGLILPGLLRFRPVLTPLAALGLVLDMIGATAYNLINGQIGSAVMTVVLGLICVAIAYCRRSWAAR
jgi:DoxX-like protein